MEGNDTEFFSVKGEYMGFQIVKQNIVEMGTDAIVNAANTGLSRGSGVCGAIFYAAGAKKLQEECDKKAPCPTGKAVLTNAYQLKAKYIIHAVGPVWNGGAYGEKEQLHSAYESALELASENGCTSIAFPLISAGIYGYPKKEAMETAVSSILQFLEKCEMEVFLVLFDEESFQVAETFFGQYVKKEK